MTDDSTSGRRILLVVAAIVIPLAGILGLFVGSNGAETVPQIQLLFGTVEVPTTPVTMAMYAMLLTVLVLGGLFALVESASRLEDAGARE